MQSIEECPSHLTILDEKEVNDTLRSGYSQAVSSSPSSPGLSAPHLSPVGLKPQILLGSLTSTHIAITSHRDPSFVPITTSVNTTTSITTTSINTTSAHGGCLSSSPTSKYRRFSPFNSSCRSKQPKSPALKLEHEEIGDHISPEDPFYEKIRNVELVSLDSRLLLSNFFSNIVQDHADLHINPIYFKAYFLYVVTVRVFHFAFLSHNPSWAATLLDNATSHSFIFIYLKILLLLLPL
ncbi:unnamed protein product [Protopolystoma xenopodis]|uniref:Uncharacterized protein n=1 Tax=Protopolystoma xenopodis TaxID=117903 RepID=A0A448XLL3_9PLAT|nr:unnamed protein product [Protopolystoma xenopodis]